MDKQAKIKKIANMRSKASKVSNLEVLRKVLHDDYTIEQCSGVMTETGNLEVLKIVPKADVGAKFSARWDQRSNALDIDILGASRNATRNFRANRDGYSGHHTNRSTIPDKRIFEVSIEAQGAVIFDGNVSFSITGDQTILEQVGIGDVASAEVIKGGGDPII